MVVIQFVTAHHEESRKNWAPHYMCSAKWSSGKKCSCTLESDMTH